MNKGKGETVELTELPTKKTTKYSEEKKATNADNIKQR